MELRFSTNARWLFASLGDSGNKSFFEVYQQNTEILCYTLVIPQAKQEQNEKLHLFAVLMIQNIIYQKHIPVLMIQNTTTTSVYSGLFKI